jgi:hypothetical protein
MTIALTPSPLPPDGRGGLLFIWMIIPGRCPGLYSRELSARQNAAFGGRKAWTGGRGEIRITIRIRIMNRTNHRKWLISRVIAHAFPSGIMRQTAMPDGIEACNHGCFGYLPRFATTVLAMTT